MKGNTNAAAKKPNYESDMVIPKGSNWGNENRGQIPNQPVNMSTKEYSKNGNHFHGK